MKVGRIVFAGNPWPRGHRIRRFVWSAHLDPATGLWFDLHLVSAPYDEGDRGARADEEDDDDGDWRSKIVWTNYDSAIISSTEWDGRGFLVATERRPLAFTKLAGRTFRVPARDAFGIYLLGHDAAAKHEITFGRDSIEWSGRIALAYVGQTTFRHRFTARIPHARFAGVRRPAELDAKEARALLDRLVPDARLRLLPVRGR
jgi:hypothetical protein